MPKTRKPPSSEPPLVSIEVRRLAPLPGKGKEPVPKDTRLGTFFLGGSKPPKISHKVVHLDHGEGYKVELLMEGVPLEEHVRVPARHLGWPDLRDLAGGETPHHRPGWTTQTFAPQPSRRMPPARTLHAKGRRLEPTFIFPPDRRFLFNDISYPWRTIGRVSTARGSGTGVLVGPRHLLTVSHVMAWSATDAGWLTFAPSFNAGATPFGTAAAQLTYFYRKNSSSLSDADIAEDYVVVILDQRLGDTLGWMGSKIYAEDWDDTGYWSHVGYSADLGGGQSPSFQDSISFSDADGPGFFDLGDGLDMETTTASVTFGDSGGPYFGWWNGGPYVVGVQSAQGTLEGDSANWGGGGDPMVRLIQKALAENP